MIDFHLFQQIHHLHSHDGLSIRQIAEHLKLHPETVARWIHRERVPRHLI